MPRYVLHDKLALSSIENFQFNTVHLIFNIIIQLYIIIQNGCIIVISQMINNIYIINDILRWLIRIGSELVLWKYPLQMTAICGWSFTIWSNLFKGMGFVSIQGERFLPAKCLIPTKSALLYYFTLYYLCNAVTYFVWSWQIQVLGFRIIIVYV